MTNAYPLLTKYLRKQACLRAPINNMDDSMSCLQRKLIANSLIVIDPATNHPRVKQSNDFDDAVYYTIQIRGCSRDYPTPDKLKAVEAEISEAFEKAGISGHPIACEWRGDTWEIHEAGRIDETFYCGAGDHHGARLGTQKYQRTRGEALITYRIPAAEITQLGLAMRDIQTSVEAAKKATNRQGIG